MVPSSCETLTVALAVWTAGSPEQDATLIILKGQSEADTPKPLVRLLYRYLGSQILRIRREHDVQTTPSWRQYLTAEMSYTG
jgi:hypothetical protein